MLIEIAQRNICFNRGGIRDFEEGHWNLEGELEENFAARARGASGSILKGAKGGGALRKMVWFWLWLWPGFSLWRLFMGRAVPSIGGGTTHDWGDKFLPNIFALCTKKDDFSSGGGGGMGVSPFLIGGIPLHTPHRGKPLCLSVYLCLNFHPIPL